MKKILGLIVSILFASVAITNAQVVRPVFGPGKSLVVTPKAGQVVLGQTISDSNVNGVLVPQFYGAVSGSTTTTTGGITTALKSLVLADASTFAARQGIVVAHAGATTTVATPSAPTFAATCTGTCATAYLYKVAALDGLGGWSVASAASASHNNGATLEPVADYNTVSITPLAGVEAYAVYQSKAAAAYVLIGLALNSSSGSGNTTVLFKDYGQSYTAGPLSSTPPAAVAASNLSTTIASLSGTTATLTAAAGTTVVGGVVYHDDCALIQLAVNAVDSTKGGSVSLPSTAYSCSHPVQFGSVGGAGNGLRLFGRGEGTSLTATAALAGSPMIKFENATHSSVNDMQLTGNAAGPPVVAIQSDRNNPMGAIGGIGRHQFVRVNIRGVDADSWNYGIAMTAAPSYDSNNEQNELIDVKTINLIGPAVWIGHAQSLEHKIIGGELIAGWAAIALNGGSVHVIGTTLAAGGGVGANAVAGTYLLQRGVGYYFHDTVLDAVVSENGGDLLYVDVGASDHQTGVRINGSSTLYFPASSPAISQNSTSTILTITNSNVGSYSDAAAPTYTFAGRAYISNSALQCGPIGGTACVVSFSKRLILSGNEWFPAPTLTNTGGVLSQRNDFLSDGSFAGLGSAHTLATFGTCAAEFEGFTGLQSNSTAGCAAGATATNAGTTHCAIYCNGTNWLQTGL